MKISFTIVGVIDLDDDWGSLTQIQQEIQHDFRMALLERSQQWSPGPTPTTVQATVTTHPHIA